MKTSSATITINNTALMVDDRLSTLNFSNTIMKKLSNTSPFLLLLLPFFMMLVFTITLNTQNSNDEEMVVKPAKTSTSIAKQVSAIFK